MDLNLLKIFIKVADCGSLTKASKLLNHPKSKISRDIVKLENEFQQTLLKRSPRGVILTEQGFSLLQSTREQLEKLESSIQQIKTDTNTVKGSIKITAPEDLSNFLLTRLINEFIDRYPDISVELYSTTEFLDFQKYNIDLALRIGKLKDSNLIQRKLAEVNVIFVASKFFTKSNPQITQLSDLKKSPIALIKNIHGVPLNPKALKGIQPIFASNSTSTLKDFVKRNRGIATLPKILCQKELNENIFEHILPNETYMTRNMYLLSPPSSYTPKHVKFFKDFISDSIKKEF